MLAESLICEFSLSFVYFGVTKYVAKLVAVFTARV